MSDPGPPPDRSRTSPIRIIFAGDLSERKGVPELLQALARPELRELDWTLTLAGGGQLERFKAEAERLGLTPRLTFTGWVTPDQMVSLYRQSQVFTLPSHAEGQAMSLLEAMAHGLPIVATPVGSHLEAVEHGTSALLVTPGDVPELARTLAAVVADQGLRQPLGTAARARYEEAFSIRRYVAALAGIYADALGRTLNDTPRS